MAGAVAATNFDAGLELVLALELAPELVPELVHALVPALVLVPELGLEPPALVQRAHEGLVPCLGDRAGQGPDMAEPAEDRDGHIAQPACSFAPVREPGQSRGLEAPASNIVGTPPGSAEAQDHFGVAPAGTDHSEKNGAGAGPYRRGFASRARRT